MRKTSDGLYLERRGEDRGIYGGKQMTWKGVTLQWFGSATKAYASQSFSNDVIVSRGSTTLNRNTWTSTKSGIDSKGKPYRFRDTKIYSGDGKTASTKAELSVDDGKTWMAHWEDTGTKMGK